jgi:hypothetical protein
MCPVIWLLLDTAKVVDVSEEKFGAFVVHEPKVTPGIRYASTVRGDALRRQRGAGLLSSEISSTASKTDLNTAHTGMSKQCGSQ